MKRFKGSGCEWSVLGYREVNVVVHVFCLPSFSLFVCAVLTSSSPTLPGRLANFYGLCHDGISRLFVRSKRLMLMEFRSEVCSLFCFLSSQRPMKMAVQSTIMGTA